MVSQFETNPGGSSYLKFFGGERDREAIREAAIGSDRSCKRGRGKHAVPGLKNAVAKIYSLSVS
jgi:hypothetical protein